MMKPEVLSISENSLNLDTPPLPLSSGQYITIASDC